MTHDTETRYREKLWPAAWLYLATALVIPASLLVFLPIDYRAGIVTAAVLYGGALFLLLRGAPVIEVTDTELRAGRARVPLALVGDATAHDGEEARLERGQRLDARAWLLIRGWVSPVARIEIVDADDPTPYWLVSTRTPEQLIAAIAAARG